MAYGCEMVAATSFKEIDFLGIVCAHNTKTNNRGFSRSGHRYSVLDAMRTFEHCNNWDQFTKSTVLSSCGFVWQHDPRIQLSKMQSELLERQVLFGADTVFLPHGSNDVPTG